MTDFPNAARLHTRRGFLSTALAGSLSAGLSACVNVPRETPVSERRLRSSPSLAYYRDIYDQRVDGDHVIPAVPIERIDPQFYRQVVTDPTGEPAGTIVIDTSTHFLYLVEGGGRAMRYGVGLGRAGFEWAGRANVGRKREWPRWFPPQEMIERQPELEKYHAEFDKKTGEWTGGMEPGITNPLGARAMYLYQDGKDTLYRIHGSPEWWSIGKSVSSGCVRLMNQDIIDLYDRVPKGTPVWVTAGLGMV